MGSPLADCPSCNLIPSRFDSSPYGLTRPLITPTNARIPLQNMISGRCPGAVEEILHAPAPVLGVSARADLEELKQAQTIRERNRQRIIRIGLQEPAFLWDLFRKGLSISPVASIGNSFVPPTGTASSMPEYRPARTAFAIGISPLHARKPALLLQLSCYRPRPFSPATSLC